LDYSYYFKDVKISVGIFDSTVGFLNIAYPYNTTYQLLFVPCEVVAGYSTP